MNSETGQSASGTPSGPVLVLSGSLRAHSVTDAVGRYVTNKLADLDVQSNLMTVRDLALPFFDPDDLITGARLAAPLLDAARAARAMIWCTPGYHRSVSGSFKNVLDYLEFLADDSPAYLNGKAIGLVAVAGGLPASVSALTTMEFTVHSLRAYVIPYSVPVPFASQLLDADARIKNEGIRVKLDLLCNEVVAFLGNWRS